MTTPAPTAPTKAQLQSALQNTTWYTLSLWPALTTAVASGWGGPDSSDKRDFLAAHIADLLLTTPNLDHDDLIVVLLQFMQDEFELNVEDDSEEVVAGELMNARRRVVMEGDLGVEGEMEARWRSRGQLKGAVKVQEVEEEGEWEGISEEDEDEDEEMGGVEVGPVRERKEKVVAEVDEDGFTKVVAKKKR